MGFFSRLFAGLAKARNSIMSGLDEIFSGFSQIDDDFYEEITPILRKSIEKNKAIVEGMSILKPFSFVLENDDKESVAELYLVDDELVIIDPDLMTDLDDDLNAFLENLLKD